MNIKNLLTAMALLLPLSAIAQEKPHWDGPSVYAYPDETPIYVQVNINGVPATADNNLELAAFIGEDCRAYASSPTEVGGVEGTTAGNGVVGGATQGSVWYTLRVWGDKSETKDLNKEITFRAFYDNIEYEFTTKVPFTGETYTPAPLVLNLDAVTNVTLAETITINQPATAFPYTEDLKQYITFVYGDNADKPYEPLGESKILSPIEYEWNAGNYANQVSFDGTKVTITPAEAQTYSVMLYVYVGDRNGEYKSFVRIPTTIEVDIKEVQVTGIACDLTDTEFYAFEDFGAFIDGHITITPENASNQGYSITCNVEEAFSNNRFNKGGRYTIQIVPSDQSYQGQPATVNVTVYVRPINISINNQVIEVPFGSNVFDALRGQQTITWPSDDDPGDWGKSEVNYTMSEDGFIDATNGKAIKIGEVSVTAKLKDGITPVMTMQGKDNYTVRVNIVSALEVTAQLSDFTEFVKTGNPSGQTPAYVYVSNPGKEPFDLNDIKINFDYRYEAEGLPYAKQIELQKGTSETQDVDAYSFIIQPLFIGTSTFNVTYQGKILCRGQITISGDTQLSAGWNWMSLITQGDAVENIFGKNDFVEIRSQMELLWNDPTYGFVGNIKALTPYDGMYKVKTSKVTHVGWSGEAIMAPGSNGYSQVLNPGYNWVNYPYEFDITLDRIPELFGPDFQFADGDRIITLENSFAIYDQEKGEWTADETFALKEGQGVLYFRNSEDESELQFSPAFAPSASAGDAAGHGVKAFAPRHAAADLFQYDVHAYADNMSMVAEVEGLENPEDYTLGVFVNGECRGRGRVAVDGKMFVSAVGVNGENMTFKLVNNNTGEMMLVKENVSFGQIKGSLRAPVMLNIGTPTGINKVDGAALSSEAYDLSGRRISDSQRGIIIERMADGSIRKVVKK